MIFFIGFIYFYSFVKSKFQISSKKITHQHWKLSAVLKNTEDEVLSIINNPLISVCKVCKKAFNPLENSQNSCQYHKGRWMGAENSKHMGTRSGGQHLGLSLFWDCCEEERRDGPGCCRGMHMSYDCE